MPYKHTLMFPVVLRLYLRIVTKTQDHEIHLRIPIQTNMLVVQAPRFARENHGGRLGKRPVQSNQVLGLPSIAQTQLTTGHLQG